MTFPTGVRVADITRYLAKCAPIVEQVGATRWDLALSNGRPLLVSAQLEEEWLLLDAPLDGGAPGDVLWKQLEWNGQLGGASKFAWLAAQRSLHLRAEIPLDEEVDLAGRLRENCAGFMAALEKVGDGNGGGLAGPGPMICPGDLKPGASTDLPRLLKEAGWAFTERSGGRLAVDLRVGQGFYQAMVEEAANCGVQVAVELARPENISPASRQALAALLLTMCGIVRLARAAAEESQEQTAAWFEVRFATPPSAVEVGHALAALSVACRLCGREVKVLEDETIASQYLAMRGLWGRPEGLPH